MQVQQNLMRISPCLMHSDLFIANVGSASCMEDLKSISVDEFIWNHMVSKGPFKSGSSLVVNAARLYNVKTFDEYKKTACA